MQDSFYLQHISEILHSSHTSHGPTRQALQLHPTHQREGDRAPPHMPTPVWGPPILWRAMPPFSLPCRWVFSLFFSSLTLPHLQDHAVEVASQHRRDRAAKIVTHDPPMTDLSLSRSTCPFPSIFDHSLFLPLSVWPNCLSLTNGFVLIFVSFKFIYCNFLL